jgi:peroxiredoxin
VYASIRQQYCNCMLCALQMRARKCCTDQTVTAAAVPIVLITLASSTAEVVGISLDDVASHRSFCSDLKLSFPLLADTDGTVSTLYG